MLNRKFRLLVLLVLVSTFLLLGCSSNSLNQSSEYTLVVNSEGEGNVVEDDVITTEVYENGTEVQLTAVTDVANWLFSHWEGDYSGNENPVNIVMNKDKTITAVFQSKVLIGSEPYEITNWYQLNEIRSRLSANYILMEDLDDQSLGFSDLVGLPTSDNLGWEPIGDLIDPFAGNFDGNNKTINNLYINRDTEDYVGLFGCKNGEIENLIIKDYIVIGDQKVGGLVGKSASNVTNCSVTGNATGTVVVGGLVGANSGTITNCCASGEITGTRYLGGLVGFNTRYIYNSYAQVDATGTDTHVGGLVGYVANGSIIRNSYAIGRIQGASKVGGLIGETEILTGSAIEDTYSAGTVIIVGYSGGLIGVNQDTNHLNVHYSYWDNEVGSAVDISSGGEGKTTNEMSQEVTFIGWDFMDIWIIDEGDTYPYLKWQTENIPNIPTG